MSTRFVIARAQGGERLDKALAGLLPKVSRASIQRWIVEERISLNGRSCRARDLVGPGDVVVVEPAPPPPSRALPDPEISLQIVYQDADLVVVNKQAGLVVHPGRGHRAGTLVNGLLALEDFGVPPVDPLDPEGAMRPGIVHRIDKDTSGLLVVAKTVLAREALKQQLAAHSVHRVYRALTVGVPTPQRVHTLHARHPRSRLKFTSRTPRGREAITTVEVVERLAGGRAALIECRLQTGRTHQIRVHLAEQLGHPLLADTLYGRPAQDADMRRTEQALGRQALHAAELGFIHPRSGEAKTFAAPLPEDMRRALECLRLMQARAAER
jgi:23S rRNA pseudouridine1911/1915/1917 synthase